LSYIISVLEPLPEALSCPVLCMRIGRTAGLRGECFLMMVWWRWLSHTIKDSASARRSRSSTATYLRKWEN
jgi:hypothetical protein